MSMTDARAHAPLIPKTTKALALFLFGFIVLFLELLLIRYLAGNIWNLGYFPNFVLIATFLGMGAGFTFHRFFSPKTANYFIVLAAIIILLLVSIVTFNQVVVPGFSLNQSHFGNLLFFTQTTIKMPVFLNIANFLVCFILVVLINFFICVKMAKLFCAFQPLQAYTLDILGSCAGILAFALLSYLQLPAFYWFTLLAIVCVIWLMIEKPRLLLPMSLIFCLTVLVAQLNNHRYNNHFLSASQLTTLWSPYQKIQFYHPTESLTANNIPHQAIHTKNFIAHAFYSIPYLMRAQMHLPRIQSALILGAGTGNDATAALMHQVNHIDAVEIDPIIAKIGERYNQARPYENPHVFLHITDGRRFLTQSHRQYQLIIFALTDSVVRAGSLSQLRLENYLFTKQSLEKAYKQLTPDGQIYLYNYYRQPWIAQKIEAMLHQITGHYPKVLPLANQFYVISIGKNPASYQSTPNFTSMQAKIPTDNWPFLYLKSPEIPSVYLLPMLCVSLLVILLLAIHQRVTPKQNEENVYIKLAFLLMGSAFLLLETKGVLQFSLLFGNTWLNNALVFFAVLLLILLANWLAYLLPSRYLMVAYALLILASLTVSFIPIQHFLTITNNFTRFIQAALLIFSPIFFANLVFGLAFKQRRVAEHVFGWNLLGAVFGGVLEYTSMLFGYQLLTFFAAFVYIASFALLFYGLKRSLLKIAVR